MSDTKEEPRIGVFVCHCGHNIAGAVDVVAVAEMAKKLPYVTFATDEMFMCSDAGQTLIKDKVKEFNLNRVVVASCSPRMHEPTFRRVVEEVGVNRYLFDQVNLREHVSWCHTREPVKATEKAKDLVRMSVARAINLESLPIKTVKVLPITMVVGGGIAGLRASLDIAERGFDVILVEKDTQLGGNVAKWTHLFPSDESGAQVIGPLIAAVRKHKRIKIHLNSKVSDFDGYIGNFGVTIKNLSSGKETKVDVGTVIVSTGFEAFKPVGYYGYTESPNIVTLAELQEMAPAQMLVRPSDGKPVKKIVFIGCVGSREPGKIGHEHCSRHCCSATAKAAADLRDRVDEALVLYQDIRTYGKGHEEFHRLARQKHVIYSKFPTEAHPKVEVDASGKIRIRWFDVLAGSELEFEPDLVVLASAMIPPPDMAETAKMFSLTRSGDGFFNPEHIKLAPLTTHTAGVMIAGAAQAAKNASEAVIDASGAAAKAVGLMAQGEVEIESTVSHVLSDLCSSCHTCITACPYGAIVMDEQHDPPVAFVQEAKCKGCGTCAAACPSSAIVMYHSTDQQILTMVEAYLCPSSEAQGGGSA
ncbi:CoB--CoM heterodisulfide reductase iron-sulfur subunit A family protein [Candidatus Thorarchaeota archaeon]|nr:MAG: CoB--CoM heterodisulfide reductase iron-sulfur subunit A family protein [Candidatus Thorarchaeota archaeon]